MSWQEVEEATGYNLYYATESISALTFLSNLEALEGSTQVEVLPPDHTVSGLSNNVAYYLVVTALVGSAESDASNEIVATPRNPLNDTGIIVSGNGTSGINNTCTKAIQNEGHVPQDCDQGRDADGSIAENKVGTLSLIHI